MGYDVMSNYAYHPIINTPITFGRVCVCQFLTFLPPYGSATVRCLHQRAGLCQLFAFCVFIYFFIFFFSLKERAEKKKAGQTHSARNVTKIDRETASNVIGVSVFG